MRPGGSALAQSLPAITGVALLAPEQIPDMAAIEARLGEPLRAACIAAITDPVAHLEAGVQALTHALPRVATQLQPDVGFMIETGQPADGGAHDVFFRVRRFGHTDPLGFLRGQLVGLQCLAAELAETPTVLDRYEIDAIAHGMRAAVALALRVKPPDGAFAFPRASKALHADFPIRRWVRGHQVFLPLVQGLIFGFRQIEVAHRAGDDDALLAAAVLCRDGLLASARALELTGDFPGDRYEDIRIGMEPPNQPRGFSGLLMSDHKELVSRMRAVRPSIDRLQARMPEAYAGIMEALSHVYDSHKHVCSRFVGTDKSSLLMSKEIGRSAIEQLDRFKSMRLRSLGGCTGADEA